MVLLKAIVSKSERNADYTTELVRANERAILAYVELNPRRRVPGVKVVKA
jgi:hypothetical protein